MLSARMLEDQSILEAALAVLLSLPPAPTPSRSEFIPAVLSLLIGTISDPHRRAAYLVRRTKPEATPQLACSLIVMIQRWSPI